MVEDTKNRASQGVRPQNGRSQQRRGSGKVTRGHGKSPKRDAARKAAAQRKAGGPALSEKQPTTASPVADAAAEGAVAHAPADAIADKGAALKTAEGVGSTRMRDRKRLSDRMGRETRLRLWLQSSALDFLLVLVVSTALVFTVSFGFYSAWDYRGNVLLIAGLCLPLLLVMFAGSWSKKAVAFSVAGVVVLTIAYTAVATALSPDPALFTAEGVNDVEGNYVIFAIVVCVTTVVAYLLSRRTVGLVFLLVLSIIACGAVQFLYREWVSDNPGIAATIAALLGLGMLFVYQCYRQSVYSANRVKRTSFAGAFGFSAIVALVCVLVGAGAFYGVVAGLDLETPAYKPFETHVSPPVDELANDYERQDSKDDDKSDVTDDDMQQTNEPDEGGEDVGSGGLGILQGSFVQAAAQQLAGYDPNDPEQDYKNIAYLVLTWEFVILIVLAILAVLAAVLLQRYRRTLRLKRIASKSPAYQAWYLYTFLLGRLKRMKINKPDHLTPLEFAVGFSKPMLPFTRGTDGVDFVDVSSIYQDAAFGGVQPTVEDMGDLHAYYRAFFKNAREYVGWPKWVLWKFWRI